MSIILSIFALQFALLAYLKARGHASRLEDLEADIRRSARTTSDDTDEKLDLIRKLLARVASGKTTDADMIREGRLWRDVLPAEGLALVEQGNVFLLDVRTGSETSSGMLPGATHIPITDLEERFRELPSDGQAILIYCASGGRSAAACELLSREGFDELSNLAGGISSWTGPIQR